jgi:acyl dehydratase
MNKEPITLGFELEALSVSGITFDEVKQYAAVSGDQNPIHLDKALAKKAGLSGLPVQGMLLMAHLSSYVENWKGCGAINNLRTRFVSALIVDCDFTISARVVSILEDQQMVVLRISAKQDGNIICVGEAEVSVT